MNNKEQQLWNKIKKFEFDKPEEDYSFSTKLAYENTWSEKFTNEAILEYKRFMFLAVVSSKMVSPSFIVDIVWHLHLTCSDAYEEFCEVLGKKIKHVPSKGRVKDIESLKKAVQYTDINYKQHFRRQQNEVISKVRSFEEVLTIEKPNKFFQKIDNYHLGSLFLLLLIPLYFFWKSIIIDIPNPEFLFIAFLFFLFTIFLCI